MSVDGLGFDVPTELWEAVGVVWLTVGRLYVPDIVMVLTWWCGYL